MVISNQNMRISLYQTTDHRVPLGFFICRTSVSYQNIHSTSWSLGKTMPVRYRNNADISRAKNEYTTHYFCKIRTWVRQGRLYPSHMQGIRSMNCDIKEKSSARSAASFGNSRFGKSARDQSIIVACRSHHTIKVSGYSNVIRVSSLFY